MKLPWGRLFLMVLSVGVLPFLTGCGVVTDLAKDQEWRWGFFGGANFISPVKLKVGVAPFYDEVGLGTPEAGPNLARLLEAGLVRDDRLVVIPTSEVAAAMNAQGLTQPLTPAEAATLGRLLGLNALVTGSVNEVKQYSLRKGWRRTVRLFTAQRHYVDAMLAVTTMDAATGIVLASRASRGEYSGGAAESELFPIDQKPQAPTQEALETSLDAAIEDAGHRVLEGLSALPFKAVVTSAEAGSADIAFGEDVSLAPGDEFVALAIEQTITNAIGDSYQVLGAPKARLTVEAVYAGQARLTVVDGQVLPGDLIQAID